MHVLIAPDKFKGSLSAAAAAQAMARGFSAGWPGVTTTFAPIADGGEGFAEALCTALGGEWITTRALDPIEREVDARYVWIEQEKIAVIEMAEASGLWRLRPDERAPLRAHTYGTGQLIRHATARGAQKILVGLGGSATTDGGVGMAAALGYDILTSDGDTLAPYPGDLLALIRVESRNAIALPEIIAACDVRNPLLGERGTARVFSPQKGADPKTVEHLESALSHLAETVAADFEVDHRDTPGAGAAGGIGYGLLTFCGAKVRPGFDLVAETLHLEEKIAAADLVITGEGRLDDQTLDGKGPAGIAELARRHGKPVIALAGSVTAAARESGVFDAALPIVAEAVPLDEAFRRAGEFLAQASENAARLLRLGAMSGR